MKVTPLQNNTPTNVFSLDYSSRVEYRVKAYTKWFGAAQSFVTYGMEALCRDEVVFSVDEISVDYEKVKKFVSLCNSCNASLCHIEEMIHDYFYFG
jgi:hypothetical protein